MRLPQSNWQMRLCYIGIREYNPTHLPEISQTKQGQTKMTGIGHNSKTANYGGIPGEHLRQYIERIERLQEEIKAIQEDVKEVFGEAKANGFDVKIMRKVLSVIKLDAADREEQEALLDLYMQALGMIPPAAQDE